ncbi:universal stress protein [Lewinella sp. JB7]|uniref:universal stress protein n=1 Tax=Lewinella sp. JB7 TaxID=2962887 RepID=UPI0020C9CD4D|nr:universal stress protein [Lewinella sp. JB7]MCP9234575.1 universal stress protein [Lewinella sp. JB7]
MKTITSILVPTDFSQVATNAFRYALRLADVLDARIELLHVIPPTTANPTFDAFMDTLTATLQAEAHDRMTDFFGQGVSPVEGLTQPPDVQTFIRVGDLRHTIRQHVAEEGNQLIVMGTAGRDSGWDDFLGTNASYLINRAPCPVLVVPRNASYRPLDAICFATDLNDIGAFRAGGILRTFRPFHPRIEFLHIRGGEDDEETDFNFGLLRDVFDRPGVSFQTNYTDRVAEDLVGAIFAFAFEQKCQLVVMYRPDRPWLHRLLSKSNTSAAVMRARLPLLILTAEDGATD